MTEFNPAIIKLVIGLGNPGSEYANTYHNAGFLFIDYLEKNRGASRFTLHASRLLKSNVFMNESGSYVKKVMKKYGAKPGETLVIHDDSDITLGDYKLSFDRNSAGHKGVQSVIDALGTKKFWRLRIGIRPSQARTDADLPAKVSIGNLGGQAQTNADTKKPRRVKAKNFVLKKINRADREALDATFERAAAELIGGKDLGFRT